MFSTEKVFGRSEILPNFGDALIAGVDEAGRGPLAGPVIAAAVILPPLKTPRQRRYFDSKQHKVADRIRLCGGIRQQSLACATGHADVEEIDELNILNASLLAMKRALAALQIKPDLVLVDGNRVPDFDAPCYSVVGGDARVESISAASIVAKVTRDEEMLQLHARYPVYNFASHKGYPTREHIRNLDCHGVCEVHRKSYRPVRERLVAVRRAEAQ